MNASNTKMLLCICRCMCVVWCKLMQLQTTNTDKNDRNSFNRTNDDTHTHVTIHIVASQTSSLIRRNGGGGGLMGVCKETRDTVHCIVGSGGAAQSYNRIRIRASMSNVRATRSNTHAEAGILELRTFSIKYLPLNWKNTSCVRVCCYFVSLFLLWVQNRIGRIVCNTTYAV